MKSLFAALALAALTGATSFAQTCPQSDGLSSVGPCCSVAIANLPVFPPLSLPGLGLCFSQCNPAQQPNLKVNLGGPAQNGCASFQTQFTLTGTTGVVLLSGMLTMDYTRNWIEVAPSGIQYEVWRFVVKGDLGTVTPPAPACPAASCITAANPKAFYYGYADYAYQCGSGGVWEGSLVLYHGCDRFSHSPVSSAPGLFHPGVSYALVAPVSAANPFVPATNAYGNGPLLAEAVRPAMPVPGTILCQHEEAIAGGLQFQLGSACACPLSFANPMHSANLLQGTGTCPNSSGVPSGFQAINVAGQPWIFEIKTSIGNWTNPAGPFPGDEAVWVDEGIFDYYDACATATGTVNSLNVFYGASTQRGFNVLPIDPGFLNDKMIDLASNFHLPAGGTVTLPATNIVLPTQYLIYTNIP